MSLFEGLSLLRLGFHVRVDLRLVGMVVSEGRMNLRQRQVAKLPRDLLRNQTHVVPLSDPANGDTRPGNARPPAANVRASRDQATYLGHGCHDFKYNAVMKPDKPAGKAFCRKSLTVNRFASVSRSLNSANSLRVALGEPSPFQQLPNMLVAHPAPFFGRV